MGSMIACIRSLENKAHKKRLKWQRDDVFDAVPEISLARCLKCCYA